MKIFEKNILLRFAVAAILLTHSIPGIFNNGIHDFGKYYLDEVGFAPFGVALAWTIKLSHIVAAICLLLNKYVKLASLVTIAILITGIFMVHLKDGWYVVGAGRNGIEFNFLMIIVLLTIMFSRGQNQSGINK
jgi:putative oxidoreductase